MLFHRFSEKEWNFLKNDENNECFSCLMFYSRTGNAGRLEEEITDMKVDILSREYPPKVYGGAGVHAEELSKVLAERVDVTVRAFDGPRTAADIPAIPGTDPKGSLTVVGYDVPKELEDANGALKTFGVDLQIANDVDADIIHAHTWYACLAGYLAKMLHDTPLVITAHSLEPFRPWKREQLGGGYNLSSWAEKDAYEHADRVIAVRGNCEAEVDQMVLPFPVLADYCLLEQKGRVIFATHGHHYNLENPPLLQPGDVLLHGHTHIPAKDNSLGFWYLNPGSVSIPKENSPHSYMTLEDGQFLWKDLDGAVYDSLAL